MPTIPGRRGRLFYWAVALALICLALFTHPNARADDDLAAGRELIAEVALLLGRAVPAPRILQVDDEAIFQLCKCHARALFVDGTVLVSQSLDVASSDGRAILAHELVHLAQYLERGTAADCRDWLAREDEASRVERRWRVDHGARLPPPTFYRCIDPAQETPK